MSERHELRLPLAQENGSEHTHLHVEVYYAKGGINYFTYKREPRGIYFGVHPVTILEDGCERSVLGQGCKWLLRECNRLDRKAVQELFLEAKHSIGSKDGEIYQRVAGYLNEQHLKLREAA